MAWHLDGAAGDEVEGDEHVTVVIEGVAWRRVDGLEAHGEGSQAGLAGAAERLTVLQQRAVQMQANVCL